MGNTVRVVVLLCPRLSGEQSRKSLVKVDQVLRVFSAFVFVLRREDIIGTEGWVVLKPTVFKSDGLDHPLSTCASFHAKQCSVHAQLRGEMHTEIMGIIHAGVHTLT